MTNLKWIPAQDDFETTLSATYNGWVGSMWVFNIPDSPLPAGEHTYVVIEPWTENMQVVKVSWWTSNPNTFIVSDVAVEKAEWVNYTATSHPANSVVRISNNFAFWKNIKNAVNSKAEFTTSGSDKILSVSWNMQFKDDNVWPISLSDLWWEWAKEVEWPMIQDDYDDLPSSKLTDWKYYLIYEE